ncbi:hypothetical protein BDV93DRAFT_514618 [Ceratobasidium sp. AG-I]|nr:hypothetical protein BDV93DRAFT_514618 [Ceratobasidium sp. AG-I]
MQVAPPLPLNISARIASLVANPPHYEDSFCGPLNTVFQFYYPLSWELMVKPQAVIRKFNPHSTRRMSTDSYHREVQGVADWLKPDFIICRFSPDGRNDRAKLVIEVKAQETAAVLALGTTQILSYLNALNAGLDAAHGGGTVQGILICQTTASFFNINPQSNVARRVRLAGRWVWPITSPEFRNFLHTCALAP